jgi:hypothetical protein
MVWVSKLEVKEFPTNASFGSPQRLGPFGMRWQPKHDGCKLLLKEHNSVDESLKSEIVDIASLVKTLPETLQLRAFEMLLQHCLDGRSGENRSKQRSGTENLEKDDSACENETRQKSSPVASMSLPLRLKAFMKKHNISAEHLDKLFHVENGEVELGWALGVRQTVKTLFAVR